MTPEAIDRMTDVRRHESGHQKPYRKCAHGERDGPSAIGCDQRNDQHRRVEDRAPGQNLRDAEHRHSAPGAVDKITRGNHGAAVADDEVVTSSTRARSCSQLLWTMRNYCGFGAVFGFGFAAVR